MKDTQETAGDGAQRAANEPLRAAKNALRAQVAAAVAGIRPLARKHKTGTLAAFALRAPPLGGRGVVLAYRAMPDEPCVDAVAEALAARGWRVAFPVVDESGSMRLVELESGASGVELFEPARWTTDRHGVRAPRRDRAGARAIWPRELDALLVPGRAFDRAGNRLGRGKGYYDRLIAKLRPDARHATIGVAFAEQVAASVPAGEGDRRVAWIASDRGLVRARR